MAENVPANTMVRGFEGFFDLGYFLEVVSSVLAARFIFSFEARGLFQKRELTDSISCRRGVFLIFSFTERGVFIMTTKRYPKCYLLSRL